MRKQQAMWKQSLKKKFENEMQVYDYALSLLSYRDYCAADMENKLLQKGAPAEYAAAAVRKLTEYGLIDEKRYAVRVYEAWLAKKYYGRRHLLAEMQRKHVPEQYMAEILDSFSEQEEAERAQAACELFMQRNAKKIQQPIDKKIYAAAVRFLGVRGFSTRYVHFILGKLHFTDDM